MPQMRRKIANHPMGLPRISTALASIRCNSRNDSDTTCPRVLRFTRDLREIKTLQFIQHHQLAQRLNPDKILLALAIHHRFQPLFFPEAKSLQRANDPEDIPGSADENPHAPRSARTLQPPGPPPESARHADWPAGTRRRTVPDVAGAQRAVRRKSFPRKPFVFAIGKSSGSAEVRQVLECGSPMPLLRTCGELPHITDHLSALGASPFGPLPSHSFRPQNSVFNFHIFFLSYFHFGPLSRCWPL